MSEPVKVSVIIPVYQVENYLERAVDSVLAQTLQELEIILVDDGSTDGSPQICDRYAREYPDKILVIHKENDGLGLARNTGVQAAQGEYLAFLDSDDTVDPDMYRAMYEKAEAGQYDLVMCDVKIIYVEENRSTIVSSYPNEEIDLSDYIANGNNITYSVNKLYRRFIWEENRYEKMLFEDISLIPALVTRYSRIGYVKEPFYHYYRRANTISTSFVGDMVDIIQAFRNFLDTANPAYREEAVYCAAKQILWNMTQSRTLFQADFIDLIREYKQDFLLNPYIQKDGRVKKILEYLEKEVIPDTLICVNFGGVVSQDYLDNIRENFPKSRLLMVGEEYYPAESLPEAVRQAMAEGETIFAEEYFALRVLNDEGGIVLFPGMRTQLNLKHLRLNRIFFGFESQEELETGCFGALPGHYVIRALLDSYERDNIFNKAYLPLKDRLRDFLVYHFNLRVNGRKQVLKKEIQVYLPSVLSYDMQDGDNCCKRYFADTPEGYETVGASVLNLWSQRLMENWNLYKQELNRKPQNGKKAPPPPPPASMPGISQHELELRLQEVVDNYENSTSWKLTKPIRALGNLFEKLRK